MCIVVGIVEFVVFVDVELVEYLCCYCLGLVVGEVVCGVFLFFKGVSGFGGECC